MAKILSSWVVHWAKGHNSQHSCPSSKGSFQSVQTASIPTDYKKNWSLTQIFWPIYPQPLRLLKWPWGREGTQLPNPHRLDFQTTLAWGRNSGESKLNIFSLEKLRNAKFFLNPSIMEQTHVSYPFNLKLKENQIQELINNYLSVLQITKFRGWWINFLKPWCGAFGGFWQVKVVGGGKCLKRSEDLNSLSFNDFAVVTKEDSHSPYTDSSTCSEIFSLYQVLALRLNMISPV